MQPDGVRFGLGAVKGAGEGAIQSILETRARRWAARIASLFALAEHVDLRLVNKKVLECLIKAGAFDGLAPGGREGYLAWRPRLLAGLDRILDHGSRHQKDRDQGQSRLFGGDDDGARRATDDAALPVVAAVDGDRGAGVREGSARPVHERPSAAALCRRAGDRRRQAPAGPDAVGGRRAPSAASSPACGRSRPSAAIAWRSSCSKTKPRKVEAVVFPEAFAQFGGLVVDDAMLLVRGKYERDEETSRLVVAEITPLDVVRERAVREVEIRAGGQGPGRNGDARSWRACSSGIRATAASRSSST